MPWQNQGGGQGPWGRGPGGGGGQSSDLDELVRKGQERLRKFFPGGGSSRGIGLIVSIVLALWLASGFYKVEPDEQGVVLRFGAWVRTTQPGLNYHLPGPIETVLTPKVTRISRAELGFRSSGEQARTTSRDVPEEALMLTGDENIVDINFTVFWLIKDAGKYLFNVRNSDATVKAVAESAMRQVIGQTPIALALAEGRQKIEQDTRTLLQTLLDEYGTGVEITQLQLQKVDPPGPVIDAFRDVQRARADQERLRNEAEAYRNDIIPRARGEAEKYIQDAEAYKQEVVARSQGDAQRFLSVYEQYKRAEDVTRRRIYIETMEDVLTRANKVFVDSSGKGVQGVLPYLSLPELEKGRGKAPAADARSGEAK